MTANRLIQHYVENARVLPWRAMPGEPRMDPYRVWLSEIMLQQTTVAAVVPRFERFLARWATVHALAAADDAEVLGEWAGLGYYARARNLIACGRIVAARGSFPCSEAELRALPGVGDYTAAAIASIAFGVPAAAIDANVARVIARLHALAAPSRAQLRSLVQPMMADHDPGTVTQALMDLGATVCRPRMPACSACPMAGDCLARARGDPEAFPTRKGKAARPHRHGIAFWTERNGMLWLVRRPGKGLLGGMTALPVSDWTEAPHVLPGPALGAVRHVFTHFSLDLTVVAAPEPQGAGWWHPLQEIGGAGLPTLFRRAVDTVLAARMDREAA